MNIKEYIETGNLEAYLLGALTLEEEAEVQADIARYPELAKEAASIEEAMLLFAASGSVSPPDDLQDKIWNVLATHKNTIADENIGGSPYTKKEARIIPLLPPSPAMRHTRFSIAAVWVVLISSIALNILFWLQNSIQKRDMIAFNSRLDTMQAHNNTLAQVVDNYTKGKNMMADTAMQTIVMHTVLKGHPMAATLYLSKDKGEAYVMMDALPQPPKGMQYQLWAIQGGKPVSMGVLPNAIASTATIEKVNSPVNSGEAFAISLEKTGGSLSPTANNIYVMGKS